MHHGVLHTQNEDVQEHLVSGGATTVLLKVECSLALCKTLLLLLLLLLALQTLWLRCTVFVTCRSSMEQS